MTGTYTTPPLTRGHGEQATTWRERWRLHSLQRIPFAPNFFYGNRVDNGQLVQVHEHDIEVDPAPEQEQKPAKETKEGNPS